MSAKLSLVPMEDADYWAYRGLRYSIDPYCPQYAKWPKSQTVQPDDGPPVLRSVDANDPPGRLAPPEPSPGTEFEVTPLATRINRLRRAQPTELDRALRTLERIVKNDG